MRQVLEQRQRLGQPALLEQGHRPVEGIHGDPHVVGRLAGIPDKLEDAEGYGPFPSLRSIRVLSQGTGPPSSRGSLHSR
ncbi:MAG: hypothetical protein MZU79_03105 [Anaerotruncus sp.]|nr:hypothetical protein [Anaerotruncus sp.]